MRTKKYMSVETEGGGYDLSISDLMSALCCIFVLLCVSLSAPLAQNTYLAHNYGIEEEKVYKEIKKELGKILEEWGAEIVPKTLAIRFSDKDSFEGDEAILKLEFKKKLAIFFPSFIDILRRHEDLIDEIRIEGHTAIDIGTNYSEDYETGMELSKDRTKSVFDYCVYNKEMEVDKNGKTSYRKVSKEEEVQLSDDDRNWAIKHIVLSNYSYSRYIWGKLSDDERKKLLEEEPRLDEKTVNLLDNELDSQALRKIINDFIDERTKNYNGKRKEAVKTELLKDLKKDGSVFDCRQKKSRRVEFRVKTHSDELMRQLQSMLGMEEEVGMEEEEK